MNSRGNGGETGPAVVLCVDDDVIFLELEAAILRSHGYMVHAENDPIKSLGVIARQHIDLAIVDYKMPRMNGAILSACLKQLSPNLPVILFSGEVDIHADDLKQVDVFVEKASGTGALVEKLRGAVLSCEVVERLQLRRAA